MSLFSRTVRPVSYTHLHEEYHEERELLRAPSSRIVERLSDGEVSVYADGAQAEDGRGTQAHVQRYPDLAQHLAQLPRICNKKTR